MSEVKSMSRNFRLPEAEVVPGTLTPPIGAARTCICPLQEAFELVSDLPSCQIGTRSWLIHYTSY